MAPKPAGKPSRGSRDEDDERRRLPKKLDSPPSVTVTRPCGSGKSKRPDVAESSTSESRLLAPALAPETPSAAGSGRSKGAEDGREEVPLRRKGKEKVEDAARFTTTRTSRTRIPTPSKSTRSLTSKRDLQDISTRKTGRRTGSAKYQSRTGIPSPQEPRGSPRHHTKSAKGNSEQGADSRGGDRIPKSRYADETLGLLSGKLFPSIPSTASERSGSALSAPAGSVDEKWPWNTYHRAILGWDSYEHPQMLVPGRGKLPGGEQYFYGRRRLKVDGNFVSEAWRLHDETKPGVVMLLERQSGTFGYGSAFKTETGKTVPINSFEDAKEAAERHKTRHLLTFGKNAQFIGTKGCMSCLGVYFELQGNRVFCAHMNIWTDFARSWVEEDNPLPKGSENWHNVREAVYNKMWTEADDYGWRKQDYIPGTLKFVSIFYNKVAKVAAAGVLDFLGNPPRDEYYIGKAHGFLIAPGSGSTPGIHRGHLFLETGGRHDDGAPIFEDVPDEFHQLRYWGLTGVPEGGWYYTVSDPDPAKNGWLPYGPTRYDWIDDRWEDISEGLW